MLVEIPTEDEIYDNIVAFWQPADNPEPGTALTFDYRMYWQADEPQRIDDVGRVVATRIGSGGATGLPRPKGVLKFVIDFEGGRLDRLQKRFDITPVIDVSRGSVRQPFAIKIEGTNRWRAFFDLELKGTDLVDMRCFLRLGDATLTETWIYQHHPVP